MKQKANAKAKGKEIFKMRCDKCAKEQIHDKQQSNKNWNVFPNIPCECGGAFKPDFK